MRITVFLTLTVLFDTTFAMAQRNRIIGPADNGRRVQLNGHVHPRAVPENELGPVDDNADLTGLTLVLKGSAEQEAALDELLARQQDRSSPDYHQWLTPEQFAERFGAS